jgi:hypothetical protein
MSPLFSTPSGRLLATAISLALVGGGLAATMAGLPSIVILGLSLLGGVCLSIVAVASMIGERPAAAMYAVILLPVALFLYTVGYGVVLREAAWGGYASMGLGAVLAALVFRSSLLGDFAPPRSTSLAAGAGQG